jgi:hypothetical protein
VAPETKVKQYVLMRSELSYYGNTKPGKKARVAYKNVSHCLSMGFKPVDIQASDIKRLMEDGHITQAEAEALKPRKE